VPASIRAFIDDSTDPRVRGYLHTPETSNSKALVLTHGAGSNAQAPLLIAVADAFCAAGFTVLRCDLPYRQSRSYGPPGPGDAARDRAGLKNAIAAVKKNMGAPLLASFARKPALSLSNGGDFPGSTDKKGHSATTYLGGHSYGGRQATMLAAEDTEMASGLLLLSYPLHPPRQPEQLRIQHFPHLRTPSLFVHGTRDPFGSPEEMKKALEQISAKNELMQVESAGHDLGFKGQTRAQELPASVLDKFEEMFG